MAKDEINVTLTLTLIAIFLAFTSQIVLILTLICRQNVSKRRSRLTYSLVIFSIFALTQWTTNFMSVYIDPDRLNTVYGRCSIFAMSMALISTYTHMTLSTFITNKQMSIHSDELNTKTIHLSSSALLAVITIAGYVWSLLDTIHDEAFEYLLWVINLLTLCAMGHLCNISSQRLYNMSILKREHLDMDGVEGYTVEDTRRCTVLNLYILLISSILYIINMILLLSANRSSAFVQMIVCIQNAVITVMVTLCLMLSHDVDTKMYFIFCAKSDSHFNKEVDHLIDSEMKRRPSISTSIAAVEMELSQMTAIDKGTNGIGVGGTNGETTRRTNDTNNGNTNSSNGRSVQNESEEFKVFSMSLAGTGDTMHVTFKMDHEDKMEYTKSHQFEVSLPLIQYMRSFVDDEAPHGTNQYMISDVNSDIVVPPWTKDAKIDHRHDFGDVQWFHRTVTWNRIIQLPEWFIALIGEDLGILKNRMECRKCMMGKDFAVHLSIWEMSNGPFEGTFRVYVKQVIRQRVEQNRFARTAMAGIDVNTGAFWEMETFTNIETFYAIEWLASTMFKGQLENRVSEGVKDDCIGYEQWVREHLDAL